MLVLRAGVGAGESRSRAAVARRLKTSVRRVAKLERRGLRRLRALCGGTRAAGGAPATTVAAREVSAPVSAAAAGDPSRTRRKPAAGAPDRVPSTVKPPAAGGVEGNTATNVPPPVDRVDLLVPLLLVLLGLAGFVVGRLLRRAPAPAAAPPEEPPPDPPPPRSSWTDWP